ncbi:MAG: PAS domain S-box protein, partial [Brevinematales bacterium]|nr:PAS domain S-box protein [Brevinematales bacterium]
MKNNNIKVFVVEDDLIYVKDLEITIKKLGYNFIGFSENAEQALSKIKHLTPDIILLDINLNNKIDGIELARQINKDSFAGIIFLTAYSEKDVIENALCKFPYGYLIKPVQEKDLDIAIKIAYRHLNLQKQITSQKKWFETINDLSPNIILFLSLEGKVEYINKKGCEILGYDKEYIVGKRWVDYFIPERIKQELEDIIFNALHEEKEIVFTHENPVLTSSGEERIILWYNKSWIGEDGKLKGYLCTGQDITEKKIFEESISLSRNAIENAGDGIICTDEKGRIRFINRAASHILGHPQELLIDKKFPSFLLLRNYHNIENFVELLKRIEKITYEVRVWNEKRGELFYRIKANIFEYSNSSYLFFHVQDITIEAQTRVELKKLSMVVEQSPVATIITDNIGNIEYVNPAFLDITGYTLKEVIGKNPSIIKSGLQDEADYKLLWKTILAGNIWKGVFQNKKKSGEISWVRANIFPIFDDKGQIVNFVAEEEDIT